MKTAAVIAELNPLHNGHAYLFEAVRARVDADGGLVVVMSGCFTQRGDPALLDKWVRARTAVSCGADLVLELPFAYATGGAGRFAAGAVATAEASGVCQELVFGSETGEMGALQATAEILADEPAPFRASLRTRLDQGESFAAARIGALTDLLDRAVLPGAGEAQGPAAGAAAASRPDPALLGTPNNILALAYLEAIRRQKAQLKPHAIRRVGATYHDPQLGQTQASATAIRLAIQRAGGDWASLPDLLGASMPARALAQLGAALADGRAPVFPADLAATGLGRLRTLSAATLAAYAGMEEGLHARLMASAARPDLGDRPVWDALLAQAATKRFASTRVRRALSAMLVGLTGQDLEQFDAAGPGPRYLRVLAFNRRGQRLLRWMRTQATLPLIMNASDFKEYGKDPTLQRMAALDIAATDVWMLARGRACGQDFDTPPIMV